VRDGDDYIINGTKIWTTHAHHANRMFALVRTNETERQQDGISFILIDMKSPGITTRPILTIGGDHEVNQVFFDDVACPSPTASARKARAGPTANICSSSSAAPASPRPNCATR
jgi:Acyl-CoA dehydrogenases